MSYLRVRCLLSQWNGEGGEVHLQLLYGQQLVPKAGAAIYLDVMAFWQDFTPKSATMTGTDMITVVGGGFDQESSLLCAWKISQTSHFYTAPAQILDGFNIQCSPNISGEPEGNSTFSLLITKMPGATSASTVEFAGAHAGAFILTPSWHEAASLIKSALNPQHVYVASSGNSILHVTGRAFKASQNYTLQFTVNTTVAVGPLCHVLSVGKMLCTSPAFHLDSNRDFQMAEMRLAYSADGKSLAFKGAKAAVVIVTRAFVSGMAAAASNVNDLQTMISVSAGGDVLNIYGSFACSGTPCTFYCLFTQDNGTLSLGAATSVELAIVISPTVLQCATPPLSQAIQTRVMTVTVFANVTSDAFQTISVPVSLVSNSSMTVVFKSMIRNVSPNLLPASINSSITITGADFDFSSSGYSCVFVLPESRITATKALPLSGSTLTCIAPSLLQFDIAGAVALHIEKDGVPITWEETSPQRFVNYFAEFGGLATNQGLAITSSIKIVARGLDYTGDNEYQLVFTSSSIQAMVAPVTFTRDDAGFTGIVALLPSWHFPSTRTVVTLEHKKSYEAIWSQVARQMSAEQVIFTFMPAINHIATQRVPLLGCMHACWPASVVIHTGAVGTGDGGLLCKFVGGITGQVILSKNVTVHPNSVEIVTCWVGLDSAPAYSTQRFELSVFQNGNLIPVMSSYMNMLLFADGIQSFSPAIRSASGKGLMAFLGFGFNLTMTYACRLNDDSRQHFVTSVAWAESNWKILCRVPVWHTGSHANVSLVTLDGHVVPYHGPTASAMLYLTAQWWFDVAPSGSVKGGVGLTPLPGYDTATPMITFTGVGFDDKASYYTTLTNVAGQSAQSASGLVLSSQKILLQVPVWSYAAGAVEVQLYACHGNETCTQVQRELGSSFAHPSALVLSRFYYVEATVSSFNVSTFLSQLPLSVHGTGFTPTNQYALHIRHGESNVVVAADSVGITALEFTLPFWPYAASQVSVHILENDAEIPWTRTSVFRYAERILKVEPLLGPVFGSIWLQGESFRRDEHYACIFISTSSQTKTPAHFVSIFNLTCDTGEQIASQVSVLLVKEATTQRVLSHDLLPTTSVLQITSAPTLTEGSLLLVGSEIMQVVGVSNSSNVTVSRKSPQSHPALAQVELVVASRFAMLHRLVPSFGSIVPMQGMIGTATIITVVGHSLDTSSDESYRCRFSPQESADAHMYPTPQSFARVTCTGSCPCVESSQTTSGIISYGPSDYDNGELCQWNITSLPGSKIFLSFPVFDTESGFDVVTINQCGASFAEDTCTEIAKVDGTGSSSTYTSHTGYLHMKFVSDGTGTRAGFVAHWTTGELSARLESEPARAVQFNSFSQLVKCLIYVNSNWTEHHSTLTLVRSSEDVVFPTVSTRFEFSGYIRFPITFSVNSLERSRVQFETLGLLNGKDSYVCSFADNASIGARVHAETPAIVEGNVLSCFSPMQPVATIEFITLFRVAADDHNELPGTTTITTSSIFCALPTCGDGLLTGAEECDDGNLVNGDNCSTSCTLRNLSAVLNLSSAIKSAIVDFAQTETCRTLSQLLVNGRSHEFHYVEMSNGIVAPL